MKNLSALVVSEDERRGAARYESNAKALSLIKGRRKGLACTVLDISETGARIELDDASRFMPKSFKLYIEEKDILVACEQVWRKDTQVGLKFSSVVNFT